LKNKSFAEKLKILIAEDDKIAQAFYEECLPEAEFEKRIRANGEDAMDAYLEWKPNIVILDIMLHEMTGYSVLKKIRNQLKSHQ